MLADTGSCVLVLVITVESHFETWHKRSNHGKKTKKIISLMNEIYQIYLLWFGRLYISFMLCSVFIYFSSYYQLSIYSWLIYILWMVLIYCFPDSGVDAVVRIEPSHGRNFFSVKKKTCCNFFIFSPRNILFVSLEFCSMYRYVAFLCQSTHFLLHIYLLLWFFFVSYFIFMKTTKKSANIYL